MAREDQVSNEQKVVGDKLKPTVETGRETVTVGLKHPHGIVIQAYVEDMEDELIPGGTRPRKVWRATGTQYVINGNRVPAGVAPDFPIEGGYALTPGIPKEVWECWRDMNKKTHPLLAGDNPLIMAYDSPSFLKDAAKEAKNTRSGLEPLLRNDDPRVAKRRDGGKFVDSVSMHDQQPAK